MDYPNELVGIVLSIENTLSDVSDMHEKERRIASLPGVTQVVGPLTGMRDFNVFIELGEWDLTPIDNFNYISDGIKLLLYGADTL